MVAKKLHERPINLIRKRGKFLGYVEAADDHRRHRDNRRERYEHKDLGYLAALEICVGDEFSN
jgi:hypothetical protein